MQRWLSFGWLIIMFGFLAGCATTQQTYQYTPPVGKAPLACIAKCKVASNSCMQFCAMKNSTCRAERNDNASARYTSYKATRQSQGLPVKKSYEDFLRTSSCEHSCNCIPAYNTCYRACGGVVT